MDVGSSLTSWRHDSSSWDGIAFQSECKWFNTGCKPLKV
jgi:hypothetical protein